MLERVKKALRLTGNTFDDEIIGLIDAGYADLALAGIDTSKRDDAIMQRAVITYCRCFFSSPDNYDALKRSYDEQKAQLQISSTYSRRKVWDDA